MGRGAHERLGSKLDSAILDLKFSSMVVSLVHDVLYIYENCVSSGFLKV